MNGIAGWSSPVARQAHNLEAVSSNLTPATNFVSARMTDWWRRESALAAVAAAKL